MPISVSFSMSFFASILFNLIAVICVHDANALEVFLLIMVARVVFRKITTKKAFSVMYTVNPRLSRGIRSKNNPRLVKSAKYSALFFTVILQCNTVLQNETKNKTSFQAQNVFKK